MKVLIIGSGNFIEVNLLEELKYKAFENVLLYCRKNVENELLDYIKNSDVIVYVSKEKKYHEESFSSEKFMKDLVAYLRISDFNKTIIYITSNNDNSFNKTIEEQILDEHAMKSNITLNKYKLKNLFGKWSDPKDNIIASYCYNTSRNININPENSEMVMKFNYIDDVVDEIIKSINGCGYINSEIGYFEVEKVYVQKVKDVINLITSFKESRNNRSIPNMADEFTKKLYSTYITFIPEDQFSYELKMNVDNRGSFTEFIKNVDRGQISVNVTKPGISKGYHWHSTKNEKFMVVSGNAEIKFRKVGSDKVFSYEVSGEKLVVVDIPCGYIHTIENVGDNDLITLIWSNELFNPENLDTYLI